ncbi:RNA methyltransferase [Streptomyces sp. NPDC049881]|uniref:TrmH family RNA methyltransferase n=1 Tax=Streptomyces sp. NPDC049881 TaxID=3155778 RepID=UPI003438BB79
MQELITSAANPLVKRVRSLADRKHRRREGAFVVEGVQPVWRAVEAGWDVDTLVVAPELLAGTAAERMVAEREAAGTRVARLGRALFERLVDREGPAGLAAVVRTRTRALEDLVAGPGAVFTALDRIANPGNLGTVIRTVDAAGGAGVVLIGDTVDPFGPVAVKASMGSLFAVDVAHAPDADTFFAWAAGNGVRVLAASGGAADDHWDASYQPPLALLFGSEREGLPSGVLERADGRLRIPMVGTAESLNVGVAAGIMLYEARRHLVGTAEGGAAPHA